MRITSRLRLATAAAVLFAGSSAFAGSLTINATFDPSLTSADDQAINAAISSIEANITSPGDLTVNLYFNTMGSGLGQSESGFYSESYYDFYNALAAVATQPNQLAALSSLGPAPGPTTGNPVNGTPNVIITAVEGRNLGFDTPGFVNVGGGSYDTEISLNTSITYPDQPNNGSYYGLQAVANHEIDEALGIGGAGSMIGGTGFFATGVGDLDLFRYSAPGVRSFSTTQSISPLAYFSIDGGSTALSYFSQTAGTDYGDWLSNPIPSGFNPQLQDAFGGPGTNPALGINEITAFNAIGYDLVSQTPEPATTILSGFGLALGFCLMRRKRNA